MLIILELPECETSLSSRIVISCCAILSPARTRGGIAEDMLMNIQENYIAARLNARVKLLLAFVKENYSLELSLT